MFVWRNFAVVRVKAGEDTFPVPSLTTFFEDKEKIGRGAEREGDAGR